MPNILLGVTGSVAALKTPELVTALHNAGHAVKVVATDPALYFFQRASLPVGILHTDADEWPRQQSGESWQRSDPVLHIELRRWADLFVIAPLDANTLAKLAWGLSDNCLTCVWRAWDQNRPVLLAPAMNTLMWEHPLTVQHLRKLAKQYGLKAKKKVLPFSNGELEGVQSAERSIPPKPPYKKGVKRFDADALVQSINSQQSPHLRLVGPISKQLACGDIGQGAMAEVPTIVAAVSDLLNPASTV